MQNDCYLITADGWVAATHRIFEEVKSGKQKGEMRDKGWACDLVPKSLIVARYFAVEQTAIEALQTELETVNARLDELAEEYGGEEGVLKDVSTKADAQEAYDRSLVALWSEEDKPSFFAYGASIDTSREYSDRLLTLSENHYLSALINVKGKLTLKAVKERLTKLSERDESKLLSDYVETDKQQTAANKQAGGLFRELERRVLGRLNENPLPDRLCDFDATVRYLNLLDRQTVLKAEFKTAEATLDRLAYERYPELTETEIKTLVVDDKWLTTIAAAVQGELDRVSQTLTGRIRQLAERYAMPLPKLVDEVAALSAKVEEHLRRMGW